jgi:hypothetical protein
MLRLPTFFDGCITSFNLASVRHPPGTPAPNSSLHLVGPACRPAGDRNNKNDGLSVNWLKILEEQRDHAREIAALTAGLLSQTDVAQEDVSRIYMAAENHAQEFAEIVDDLKEQADDEIFLEMAERIEAIWETILAAIAKFFEEQ